MNANEPIESRLEKLGRAIGSDESLVETVMSRIDRKQFTEFKSPETSGLRKFIINRFTKLAATAVIVAGMVFGIKLIMNDLAKPVYALEQTLEACKNKQQAHFTFGKDDKLYKAAWVEYDTDGNLARVRVDRRLDVNSESNEMFVWQDGHTKFYNPVQKLVMYFDDEDYSARVLHFVNRYDPRQAVEYLQKMEQKGDVEIDIEQPQDLSKPVVVTVNYKPNTFLLDANYPPMREFVFVDQKTKLVTAVELWGLGKDFEHEEVEWTLVGTYRYDRYDEPFEDGIFDLENKISKDVNIVDLMTTDSGLEFTETSLTEEQKAVDTTRKFFESLIAKDYNEATRLLETHYTAEIRAITREAWEKANLNVLEIISMDEPRPPTRGWGVMIVPCTVVVEINGRRVEKRLDVSVRRVLGHPDRRSVGFDWNVLTCN